MINGKRIMYGVLVKSPSCFSGFSGRQIVRELLRRDRPVIVWCERVVIEVYFTTCLVLEIHTITYTTGCLSVNTGFVLK